MRQYNTTLNIEMQNAQEGFKRERSKEARKKKQCLYWGLKYKTDYKTILFVVRKQNLYSPNKLRQNHKEKACTTQNGAEKILVFPGI